MDKVTVLRRLSRFMLGTVQFGMPYGIANSTGQPAYRDVVRIVSAAIDGGVNCFDTAAAYGSSEVVLGRVLRELGAADMVTIVTKVRALLPAEHANPNLARTAITESVMESRRRLQLECLPIVLFHREADAVYLPVLEELQVQGWIDQIGVSCDNAPGPAATILSKSRVNALQLPGSVLDQRHLRSGIYPAANERGVSVFVRSVFLQGLLLLPETQVPAQLRDVIPVRRELAQLASACGMTLRELALRFMLSIPEATCLVIGVETAEQVRDNLELFERGPLPADVHATAMQLVPNLPELVTTPRLWS